MRSSWSGGFEGKRMERKCTYWSGSKALDLCSKSGEIGGEFRYRDIGCWFLVVMSKLLDFMSVSFLLAL